MLSSLVSMKKFAIFAILLLLALVATVQVADAHESNCGNNRHVSSTTNSPTSPSSSVYARYTANAVSDRAYPTHTSNSNSTTGNTSNSNSSSSSSSLAAERAAQLAWSPPCAYEFPEMIQLVNTARAKAFLPTTSSAAGGGGAVYVSDASIAPVRVALLNTHEDPVACSYTSSSSSANNSSQQTSTTTASATSASAAVGDREFTISDECEHTVVPVAQYKVQCSEDQIIPTTPPQEQPPSSTAQNGTGSSRTNLWVRRLRWVALEAVKRATNGFSVRFAPLDDNTANHVDGGDTPPSTSAFGGIGIGIRSDQHYCGGESARRPTSFNFPSRLDNLGVYATAVPMPYPNEAADAQQNPQEEGGSIGAKWKDVVAWAYACAFTKPSTTSASGGGGRPLVLHVNVNPRLLREFGGTVEGREFLVTHTIHTVLHALGMVASTTSTLSSGGSTRFFWRGAAAAAAATELFGCSPAGDGEEEFENKIPFENQGGTGARVGAGGGSTSTPTSGDGSGIVAMVAGPVHFEARVAWNEIMVRRPRLSVVVPTPLVGAGGDVAVGDDGEVEGPSQHPSLLPLSAQRTLLAGRYMESSPLFFILRNQQNTTAAAAAAAAASSSETSVDQRHFFVSDVAAFSPLLPSQSNSNSSSSSTTTSTYFAANRREDAEEKGIDGRQPSPLLCGILSNKCNTLSGGKEGPFCFPPTWGAAASPAPPPTSSMGGDRANRKTNLACSPDKRGLRACGLRDYSKNTTTFVSSLDGQFFSVLPATAFRYFGPNSNSTLGGTSPFRDYCPVEQALEELLQQPQQVGSSLPPPNYFSCQSSRGSGSTHDHPLLNDTQVSLFGDDSRCFELLPGAAGRPTSTSTSTDASSPTQLQIGLACVRVRCMWGVVLEVHSPWFSTSPSHWLRCDSAAVQNTLVCASPTTDESICSRESTGSLSVFPPGIAFVTNVPVYRLEYRVFVSFSTTTTTTTAGGTGTSPAAPTAAAGGSGGGGGDSSPMGGSSSSITVDDGLPFVTHDEAAAICRTVVAANTGGGGGGGGSRLAVIPDVSAARMMLESHIRLYHQPMGESPATTTSSPPSSSSSDSLVGAPGTVTTTTTTSSSSSSSPSTRFWIGGDYNDNHEEEAFQAVPPPGMSLLHNYTRRSRSTTAQTRGRRLCSYIDVAYDPTVIVLTTHCGSTTSTSTSTAGGGAVHSLKGNFICARDTPRSTPLSVEGQEEGSESADGDVELLIEDWDPFPPPPPPSTASSSSCRKLGTRCQFINSTHPFKSREYFVPVLRFLHNNHSGGNTTTATATTTASATSMLTHTEAEAQCKITNEVLFSFASDSDSSSSSESESEYDEMNRTLQAVFASPHILGGGSSTGSNELTFVRGLWTGLRLHLPSWPSSTTAASSAPRWAALVRNWDDIVAATTPSPSPSPSSSPSPAPAGGGGGGDSFAGVVGVDPSSVCFVAAYSAAAAGGGGGGAAFLWGLLDCGSTPTSTTTTTTAASAGAAHRFHGLCFRQNTAPSTTTGIAPPTAPAVAMDSGGAVASSSSSSSSFLYAYRYYALSVPQSLEEAGRTCATLHHHLHDDEQEVEYEVFPFLTEEHRRNVLEDDSDGGTNSLAALANGGAVRSAVDDAVFSFHTGAILRSANSSSVSLGYFQATSTSSAYLANLGASNNSVLPSLEQILSYNYSTTRRRRTLLPPPHQLDGAVVLVEITPPPPTSGERDDFAADNGVGGVVGGLSFFIAEGGNLTTTTKAPFLCAAFQPLKLAATTTNDGQGVDNGVLLGCALDQWCHQRQLRQWNDTIADDGNGNGSDAGIDGDLGDHHPFLANRILISNNGGRGNATTTSGNNRSSEKKKGLPMAEAAAACAALFNGVPLLHPPPIPTPSTGGSEGEGEGGDVEPHTPRLLARMLQGMLYSQSSSTTTAATGDGGGGAAVVWAGVYYNATRGVFCTTSSTGSSSAEDRRRCLSPFLYPPTDASVVLLDYFGENKKNKKSEKTKVALRDGDCMALVLPPPQQQQTNTSSSSSPSESSSSTAAASVRLTPVPCELPLPFACRQPLTTTPTTIGAPTSSASTPSTSTSSSSSTALDPAPPHAAAVFDEAPFVPFMSTQQPEHPMGVLEYSVRAPTRRYFGGDGGELPHEYHSNDHSFEEARAVCSQGSDGVVAPLAANLVLGLQTNPSIDLGNIFTTSASTTTASSGESGSGGSGSGVAIVENVWLWIGLVRPASLGQIALFRDTMHIPALAQQQYSPIIHTNVDLNDSSQLCYAILKNSTGVFIDGCNCSSGATAGVGSTDSVASVGGHICARHRTKLSVTLATSSSASSNSMFSSEAGGGAIGVGSLGSAADRTVLPVLASGVSHPTVYRLRVSIPPSAPALQDPFLNSDKIATVGDIEFNHSGIVRVHYPSSGASSSFNISGFELGGEVPFDIPCGAVLEPTFLRIRSMKVFYDELGVRTTALRFPSTDRSATVFLVYPCPTIVAQHHLEEADHLRVPPFGRVPSTSEEEVADGGGSSSSRSYSSGGVGGGGATTTTLARFYAPHLHPNVTINVTIALSFLQPNSSTAGSSSSSPSSSSSWGKSAATDIITATVRRKTKNNGSTSGTTGGRSTGSVVRVVSSSKSKSSDATTAGGGFVVVQLQGSDIFAATTSTSTSAGPGDSSSIINADELWVDVGVSSSSSQSESSSADPAGFGNVTATITACEPSPTLCNLTAMQLQQVPHDGQQDDVDNAESRSEEDGVTGGNTTSLLLMRYYTPYEQSDLLTVSFTTPNTTTASAGAGGGGSSSSFPSSAGSTSDVVMGTMVDEGSVYRGNCLRLNRPITNEGELEEVTATISIHLIIRADDPSDEHQHDGAWLAYDDDGDGDGGELGATGGKGGRKQLTAVFRRAEVAAGNETDASSSVPSTMCFYFSLAFFTNTTSNSSSSSRNSQKYLRLTITVASNTPSSSSSSRTSLLPSLFPPRDSPMVYNNFTWLMVRPVIAVYPTIVGKNTTTSTTSADAPSSSILPPPFYYYPGEYVHLKLTLRDPAQQLLTSASSSHTLPTILRVGVEQSMFLAAAATNTTNHYAANFSATNCCEQTLSVQLSANVPAILSYLQHGGAPLFNSNNDSASSSTSTSSDSLDNDGGGVSAAVTKSRTADDGSVILTVPLKLLFLDSKVHSRSEEVSSSSLLASFVLPSANPEVDFVVVKALSLLSAPDDINAGGSVRTVVISLPQAPIADAVNVSLICGDRIRVFSNTDPATASLGLPPSTVSFLANQSIVRPRASFANFYSLVLRLQLSDSWQYRIPPTGFSQECSFRVAAGPDVISNLPNFTVKTYPRGLAVVRVPPLPMVRPGGSTSVSLDVIPNDRLTSRTRVWALGNVSRGFIVDNEHRPRTCEQCRSLLFKILVLENATTTQGSGAAEGGGSCVTFHTNEPDRLSLPPPTCFEIVPIVRITAKEPSSTGGDGHPPFSFAQPVGPNHRQQIVFSISALPRIAPVYLTLSCIATATATPDGTPATPTTSSGTTTAGPTTTAAPAVAAARFDPQVLTWLRKSDIDQQQQQPGGSGSTSDPLVRTTWIEGIVANAYCEVVFDAYGGTVDFEPIVQQSVFGSARPLFFYPLLVASIRDTQERIGKTSDGFGGTTISNPIHIFTESLNAHLIAVSVSALPRGTVTVHLSASPPTLASLSETTIVFLNTSSDLQTKIVSITGLDGSGNNDDDDGGVKGGQGGAASGGGRTATVTATVETDSVEYNASATERHKLVYLVEDRKRVDVYLSGPNARPTDTDLVVFCNGEKTAVPLVVQLSALPKDPLSVVSVSFDLADLPATSTTSDVGGGSSGGIYLSPPTAVFSSRSSPTAKVHLICDPGEEMNETISVPIVVEASPEYRPGGFVTISTSPLLGFTIDYSPEMTVGGNQGFISVLPNQLPAYNTFLALEFLASCGSSVLQLDLASGGFRWPGVGERQRLTLIALNPTTTTTTTRTGATNTLAGEVDDGGGASRPCFISLTVSIDSTAQQYQTLVLEGAVTIFPRAKLKLLGWPAEGADASVTDKDLQQAGGAVFPIRVEFNSFRVGRALRVSGPMRVDATTTTSALQPDVIVTASTLLEDGGGTPDDQSSSILRYVESGGVSFLVPDPVNDPSLAEIRIFAPDYTTRKGERVTLRFTRYALQRNDSNFDDAHRSFSISIRPSEGQLSGVQRGVVGAAMIASAVISPWAGPAMATQGVRISALLSISSCPLQDWRAIRQSTMSRLEAPIQLWIGGSATDADDEGQKNLSLYYGAAMMNVALVLGWILVHLLGAFVLYAYKQEQRSGVKNSDVIYAKLRVPGAEFFPVIYFSGFVTEHSLRVLVYGDSANPKLVCVILLLVAVLGTMGFLLYCRRQPGSLYSDVAEGKQYGIIEGFYKIRGKWGIDRRITQDRYGSKYANHFRKFGLLFQDLVGDRKHYFILDAATSIVIGAANSFEPTTANACIAKCSIMTAVFLFSFCALVFLRPFRRHILTFFFGLIFIAETVSAATSLSSAITQAKASGGGGGGGGASNQSPSIGDTTPGGGGAGTGAGAGGGPPGASSSGDSDSEWWSKQAAQVSMLSVGNLIILKFIMDFVGMCVLRIYKKATSVLFTRSQKFRQMPVDEVTARSVFPRDPQDFEESEWDKALILPEHQRQPCEGGDDDFDTSGVDDEPTTERRGPPNRAEEEGGLADVASERKQNQTNLDITTTATANDRNNGDDRRRGESEQQQQQPLLSLAERRKKDDARRRELFELL